jgi:hypothetical protein
MRKVGWCELKQIGAAVLVVVLGMATERPVYAKDVSSGTFTPPRVYVGVRSQPGRVQVDNDRKVPVLPQHRIQINNAQKSQPCGVSCKQIAPH